MLNRFLGVLGARDTKNIASPMIIDLYSCMKMALVGKAFFFANEKMLAPRGFFGLFRRHALRGLRPRRDDAVIAAGACLHNSSSLLFPLFILHCQ